MKSRGHAGWFLLVVAALLGSPPARAEGAAPPVFLDSEIIDRPRPYVRIESVRLTYTHFDQIGTGYQSRAGPRFGPGSEAATIDQPQLEVVAKQGDRITHRIWMPVDIVTAASPDAIDVVSTASLRNEAMSFDWTVTYRADEKYQIFVRNGLHNEENFRSWNAGVGGTYALAEDNTVLSASVTQVTDWFDNYNLDGSFDGHAARTSLNASLGVTQVLSTTTIGHLGYGITNQSGELGNTWNTVPLRTGDLGQELLPRRRVRHALEARLAQFLPWNGAAKAFYRFYADDWGIRAHTLELQLHQRLSPISSLRVGYRYHTQTGVDFFTPRASPDAERRTADSDLAPLHAHTVGVKGAFDIPVRFARNLHADLAIERYFRSNDLRVNVYSCGLGLLF